MAKKEYELLSSWAVICKMLLDDECGLGVRSHARETQCQNVLSGFGLLVATAVVFAVPASGSFPSPSPIAPSSVGGYIFLGLKRN